MDKTKPASTADANASPDPVAAKALSLEYEAPRARISREPPGSVAGMTLACLIGFAASAGITLFLGVFVFASVDPGFLGASHGRLSIHIAGIVYFLLATWVIRTILRLRRGSWSSVDRWGTLGLLLGTGIVLLMEGLCCFVA